LEELIRSEDFFYQNQDENICDDPIQEEFILYDDEVLKRRGREDNILWR